MPKPDLREYFTTGQWRPEYEELQESDLQACLDEPAFALRPIWEGRNFTRPLADGFGWGDAKFYAPARVGMKRLLESAQATRGLSDYEAAVARLVLESVMPRVPLVFPEGDPATRRQWVQGFAQKDFTAVKGISPVRMLRLAATRDWLEKSDPEIKKAVAECVIGAIRALRPDEPLSQDARIRLALIRHHTLNVEREDPEPDARRLMSDAGIEPSRIEELVKQIREEAGIDPLFASGTAVDLARLAARSEFKEAAAYYGFTFDVDGYNEEREIRERFARETDPWCKQLLGMALETGGRAPLARVHIARMGDDAGSRPQVIDLLSTESGLILKHESRRIIDRELAVGGDMLARRVFRALLIARFEESPSAFNHLLTETGLSSWFQSAFAEYRVSGSALAPDFPGDVQQRFVALGAMGGRYRALDPFVSEFAQLGEHGAREREREAAESAGRLWLFEYIAQCVSLSPSGYDRGRGILQDTDRELIMSLVQQQQTGTAEWWRVGFDLGTELRLCEASCRDFAGGDTRCLRQLAGRAAEQIYQSLPGPTRAVAREEIEKCANGVASAQLTTREDLLNAFRAVDAAEFGRILNPEMIKLPPDRPHPRVLGRRVAIFTGLVAILPLILCIRILFAGKPTLPPPDPSTMPKREGLLADVAKSPWIALEGGGAAKLINPQDFDGVFGANPGGTAGEATSLVTHSMSMHFERRASRWLKSHFSLGVAGLSGGDSKLADAAPWEGVVVSLPTEGEAAAIARSAPQGVEAIWIQGSSLYSIQGNSASEATSPFMRGALYVVIKRR